MSRGKLFKGFISQITGSVFNSTAAPLSFFFNFSTLKFYKLAGNFVAATL